MPRTKVNKSKAIRAYLAENPGAMPKEIVEALAKKRIRVSPQLVSIIKSRGRAPKRKQRQNGHVGIEQLIAAKVFVQRVGSISEAKQAVSALAKLL